PYLDETSRKLYEQHHVRATALLPLSSKGRWVGIVMFSWNRPHQFDERDERIFTAMIQQTAPIVDSIRLLEQTRRRAARTERLLEVNTALSQATNEEQILAAVALYAERQGAAFLSLSYIDVDETGRPVELSTVARHKDGKPWPSPVAVYRMMDLPATAMWIDEPENIVYFEDIGSDPRLDDKSRWTLTRFGDYQSTLSMPLYSAGRWSGVIVMSWLEPHDFSEDERHILGALRQTAISVVATRRAYLAEEEAREESELLYRASEAINAANSFEEIIEAVRLIDTNSDSLVLVNFEGYDFDNAGWLEVVATSKDSAWQTGGRYPFDLFPVLYEIPRHGIITFEDINTDEGIDPITRASILENNYHATISVSLSLNRRWMGMILSQSQKPRVYTPRQRRLFAGIGDLAAAAVERIRLRAESEQARLRAETLAQINAALSQSTNEEEILAAVSLLAERYHVNLSMLSYLDTGERNELLAVNAMALRSGHGDVLPLSILPIISFGPEDYPVLQNAYSHPHELLFIENLFTDPRSETGDTREFSKAVRWSAVILMPLKTGDQWLGMLQFAWEKPQQFTPEMRSVFNEIRPTTLSVVATRRAYLAVEKARRETEQRVHELETVAKVSAAVTTILDLDLLLDTVCELTETSFKLDQVNIYLLESDAENLILAESAEAPFDGSYAHAQSRLIALQDETSLVAQAGYLRHGIIVGGPSPETGPLQTMSPAAQSELAVPMVVGDKLIGVLDVQSREANRFTEADARVMTTLADLVAVAVQNARLYQQAQTLATSE
ncbi:MAG: GAF domain-containing protein, partial [Burkholderiales bacterium]|nr:GAF domain-containing protein [Anaerolineae bacterium]